MLPLGRSPLLLILAGVVWAPAGGAPPFDRVEITRALEACDPADAGCSWVRLVYPSFSDVAGTTGPEWNVGAVRWHVDTLLLEPTVTEDAATSPPDVAARFLDEARAARASGIMPGPGWWLDRAIEVVWSGDRAMTLRRVERSWTGGAHPNHHESWLVVASDGEPLELEEIVPLSARETLLTLGERAFRAYHGVPPDEPLDALGFWFEDGRFHLADNWGIEERGLVFHYNPYEVAAYALGHTEILLPWKAVANLLAADAPVPAAARTPGARGARDAR